MTELVRREKRVKWPVFISLAEAAEAARIAEEAGCAIGSVLRLAVTRGLPHVAAEMRRATEGSGA